MSMLEKLIGRLKSDDKSVEEVRDACKAFRKAAGAFYAKPSESTLKALEQEAAALGKVADKAFRQMKKDGDADEVKAVRQIAGEAEAELKEARATVEAQREDAKAAEADDALAGDESKLLDPARTRGFMRKSAGEPLPFAWVEKDDGAGVLVMDRTKAGKALMEAVRKKTGGKGTFGTATLSGSALVLNLEGKTLPSLEKKIRAWLKDNKPMPASDCSLQVQGVAVDDEKPGAPDDAGEAAKKWKAFQAARANADKGGLADDLRRKAEDVMKGGDKWTAGNLRQAIASHDKYDQRAKALYARAEASHKAGLDANVSVSSWPDVNDYAGDIKLRNAFAKDVRDQLKAAAEGRRATVIGVPAEIREGAATIWDDAQKRTKAALRALKAESGLLGDGRDAKRAAKDIAAGFGALQTAFDTFESESRALLNAKGDENRDTRADDHIDAVMKAYEALQQADTALDKLLDAAPS